MKLVTKSLLLSALLFSSSCAYFGNSKTVDVSISSNPSGADVLIEGRNYGKTPVTINIEPKNYVVTVVKEGYGSAMVNLETWQSIRQKEGEGGRCIADALGSLFVAPYFSYQSVYCRDFKQKEYFVNIPNFGNNAGKIHNGMTQDAAPMADFYYNQDVMAGYGKQKKQR